MKHTDTNAKQAKGPFKITAISLACLMPVSHPLVALAASIPLSQKPVGTGSMQPAPNVIITVDDSGSMAWELGGWGQHTQNDAAQKFVDKTIW